MSEMYVEAARQFTLRGLDWENDDFYVLLATQDYAPDITADASRASVGRAEVRPTGTYKTGGARIEGRSVVNEGFSVRLQGRAVRWEGVTGEFRYAIVYRSLGTDRAEAETLVSVNDLGPQRTTNATLTLHFDNLGVCELLIVPS